MPRVLGLNYCSQSRCPGIPGKAEPGPAGRSRPWAHTCFLLVVSIPSPELAWPPAPLPPCVLAALGTRSQGDSPVGMKTIMARATSDPTPPSHLGPRTWGRELWACTLGLPPAGSVCLSLWFLPGQRELCICLLPKGQACLGWPHHHSGGPSRPGRVRRGRWRERVCTLLARLTEKGASWHCCLGGRVKPRTEGSPCLRLLGTTRLEW